MQSQRGGTLVNVLLILMLAGVCALMFMLIKGDFKKSGTTIAQTSPTITQRIKPKTAPGVFSDGLGTPDSVIRGTLDEFGAGIDSVAEFNRDINKDRKIDRITRTHVATGNDHDYDEYKIEINNNGTMQDITPKGFRTTKGAECALRLIQFHFEPTFGATIISRPFEDTWDTPSVATKTEYKLEKNQFISGPVQDMDTVCDVTNLF